MVSRARFQGLGAGGGLEGWRDWVRERMDKVEVIVEDHPPHDEPHLLGLYQGIPLTNRGNGYFGVLPDRITLFKSPIERQARGDEERLRRVVAHTVAHEVAHFFGISDDRLREMERY